MAGWIQSFTPENRRRWKVQVDSGMSASPALHATQPRLFGGTHKGSVYSLDTSTGAILWRTAVHSKSDPRILSDLLHLERSDLVVLSSWGGEFVALDAKSGQERFRWNAGSYPRSAAAADTEGNIYCIRAVPEKGVECVRVNGSGKEDVLHREPEDERGARRALVAAGPVVDEARDSVCFILNHPRSAHLLAISLQSGAVRWRRELPSAVQAAPAVLGNGLIVPDLAGVVHGISPDGEPAFRYETGCEYLLAGAVGHSDGTCFVGDPWGRLHRIDHRGTGRAIFEARRSIQSRPSFDAAGRLYVPCTDHVVYVFG
jgi:outer membrane protein assembly factor BamB